MAVVKVEEGESIDIAAEGAVSVRTAGRSFDMSVADLASGAAFTNEAANPVWLTSVARGTPASAPQAEANLPFVENVLHYFVTRVKEILAVGPSGKLAASWGDIKRK